MKKITVYTWKFCPFCVRAKNLLKSEKLDFEEVVLSHTGKDIEELRERTKMKTVPQIFFGDDLIGGFRELSQLKKSGELHKRLGTD